MRFFTAETTFFIVSRIVLSIVTPIVTVGLLLMMTLFLPLTIGVIYIGILMVALFELLMLLSMAMMIQRYRQVKKSEAAGGGEPPGSEEYGSLRYAILRRVTGEAGIVLELLALLFLFETIIQGQLDFLLAAICLAAVGTGLMFIYHRQFQRMQEERGP